MGYSLNPKEPDMMKRILAAGALAAALCSTAQADELIFGVKGGLADIDVSGYDPITVVGGQIGYEFLNLVAADLAVEAELMKSAAAADAGEYDFMSTGLYLSARTAGPVYVIGRVGYINAEIDHSTNGKSDDSGNVLSLGLGFSTGIRTELEFTTYNFDDNDVKMISLGLHF
jgi:hypothetical protein